MTFSKAATELLASMRQNYSHHTVDEWARILRVEPIVVDDALGELQGLGIIGCVTRNNHHGVEWFAWRP